MGTGLGPKIDYVFKRLFGDEDQALLLVDLLNAVLGFPALRLVRGVLLLNPFVIQDYIEGKAPILDIRARDDLGRQFLLEMQQLARPGLAKRLLYYWAGGHAEQQLKGERYETLLPIYTICFLNETLFDDDSYHHCFRVYDAEQQVLLCKDLEMRFELNKFNVPVEQLKTPLERWCFFFKHGASLDLDNLPATLDVPMIRKAVEILMKLSQEERERHWAAERLRAQRDAASLAADVRVAHEELRAGLEKAREEQEKAREALEKAQEKFRAEQEKVREAQEKAREARQVGFDQGREKGKLIGRIQLLQQILKQPATSSDELDQLAKEDLEQREEALKQQLAGQKQVNGTSPPDPPG